MANGDRKRRKWGCVVACKDADGRIISWQARYQSPVNPRQRIYRRFGLEFQTEAYRWLDEEHALVIDHKKGIRRWTHPSARTMHGKVLFSSYATRYVINLRKKDGSELSGRSKRIQKAALDKLLPWFGETPMCDITEEFVNEWYAKACDEVRPVYGQINVYGVTTKSERHKRSYWTRTADGNGIGGRKAPVPYGS